jgi:heptosyltransferase-2
MAESLCSSSFQVALIKVGALGDVLRTTALIPGLRRLVPHLELTWVTAPGAFPLVPGSPLVNRVVNYLDPPDRPWRRRTYDWVISLDDEAASCALASSLSSRRLSGAYQDREGRLGYTPDVEPWFGMGRLRAPGNGGLARANELKRSNRIDYGGLLYRALGLPLPVERPILALPREDRHCAIEWMRARRGRDRAAIGLNTGAGGRWRFKSWGADATAQLAGLIARRFDALVVILGGPAERERNAEIVERAKCPSVLAAPCDLSILSFAALIEQLDVLVSSDSLAMHMGIALRRPVIALFGPTSDAEINLFGLGEKIVTPLDCRCCYLSDCDVRPNCMQSISLESVAAAVERWVRPSRV